MQSSMTASGTGILTRHTLNVVSMNWNLTGATGGNLIVKDLSGHVIWRQSMSGGPATVSWPEFTRPAYINGINIDTMDNGTLDVIYQ